MKRKMSELKPGQSGRVTELHNTGDIRRRLLDLGFTSGSVVRCIGKSPLGDPTAFSVKGTVIAIRRADSEKITVAAEERKDNDR